MRRIFACDSCLHFHRAKPVRRRVGELFLVSLGGAPELKWKYFFPARKMAVVFRPMLVNKKKNITR